MASVKRQRCVEIFLFQDQVIGKTSQKTRHAVEFNQNIESLEDRRAVSKEIIDQTLLYLHGVFGKDNPSEQFKRNYLK